MICRKTMSECPTPNMCAPFQGCEPAPQPVDVGWKCPSCGKGNAPWASTCGNLMCGRNSGTFTCSVLPTDVHEKVEMARFSKTDNELLKQEIEDSKTLWPSALNKPMSEFPK